MLNKTKLNGTDGYGRSIGRGGVFRKRRNGRKSTVYRLCWTVELLNCWIVKLLKGQQSTVSGLCWSVEALNNWLIESLKPFTERSRSEVEMNSKPDLTPAPACGRQALPGRGSKKDNPSPFGYSPSKRGDRWYAGCRIINNRVESLNCGIVELWNRWIID